MAVEETLALLEGIAKIVREYKLDEVSAVGVTVRRSQHEFPLVPLGRNGAEGDEDLLFHSSGG